MNFFEHQDQARQQTQRLLALFVASVFALVLGVYLVAMLLLNQVAPTLLSRDCVAIVPSVNQTSVLARPDAIATVDLLANAQTTQPISDTPPSLLAQHRSTIPSRYRRSYTGGRYQSAGRTSKSSLSCRLTSWWQPHIFLAVGSVTTAVILGASLFKLQQLKQSGGAAVAQSMRGRLVDSYTGDQQERLLLNVVEEMAIAAGAPVPAVYLLDHESGINAFAAGFTPNDAVIGVTRGSLDQLSRDELQGVIGHEFSHILNGDMRMNIHLMGWLHGILCIYLIGRVVADFRLSRDRDGIAFGLFGLALMGLGGSGLFFGRIMQSAISRQREYLADASAVQFTRNPTGLASALEKIAGVGSRVVATEAQAGSHLFFGSVLSRWWTADWLATHPPIAHRIRRIQGVQAGDLAGLAESPSLSRRGSVAAAAGFAGGMTVGARPSRQNAARTAAALPDHVLSTTPEQVMNQIGTVNPRQFDYAKGLLAQIPPSLRASLREPQTAVRVVYALMLDRENPLINQQQVDYLQQVDDLAGIEQVLQFQAQLQDLNPRVYLPMIDLAAPALRQMSTQQHQRILKAVYQLAKVDGQWTLAKFVSYLVLQYRLQPDIHESQSSTAEYKSMTPVWPESLTLIGALARIGSQDPQAVDFAFRSGLFRLPAVGQNSLSQALPPVNLGDLRKSLEKIRRVTPKLKQGIVDACFHTVMIDNRITLKEADLLRAIVILLDCPMPPLLDSDRFAV